MAGSNVFLAADETTVTVRSLWAIITALDATVDDSHGPFCLTFLLQEKGGGESIFYQTTNTAASTSNIEIGAGDYKLFPYKGTKYDLRDQYVRVTSNGQDFAIEVQWD